MSPLYVTHPVPPFGVGFIADDAFMPQITTNIMAIIYITINAACVFAHFVKI